MFRRLYVHNFRCLENFELDLAGLNSSLLIGKNGSGKSSVGRALEILKSAAQGQNKVGELVRPTDLAWGRTETPASFEVDVVLDGVTYRYILVLELPKNFRELRVKYESLHRNDTVVFVRDEATVEMIGSGGRDISFRVDWHNVALSVISDKQGDDSIERIRKWLAGMLILAPVPSLISGDSQGTTIWPDRELRDFGKWFTGLSSQWPATYGHLASFVVKPLPEFSSLVNRPYGQDSRSLFVRFQRGTAPELAFSDLSDGEKCFFICGLVLAANSEAGPLFCFWDEPDNYLAPSEVGFVTMALRRNFSEGGQRLVSSHNPEAIQRFSDENTFLMHRSDWSSPAQVRLLDSLDTEGDLVESLLTGGFGFER